MEPSAYSVRSSLGLVGPSDLRGFREFLPLLNIQLPSWVISALMRRWIIMGAWHTVQQSGPRLASEGRWTMVGSKEGAAPRACDGMVVGYTGHLIPVLWTG